MVWVHSPTFVTLLGKTGKKVMARHAWGDTAWIVLAEGYKDMCTSCILCLILHVHVCMYSAHTCEYTCTCSCRKIWNSANSLIMKCIHTYLVHFLFTHFFCLLLAIPMTHQNCFSASWEIWHFWCKTMSLPTTVTIQPRETSTMSMLGFTLLEHW